MIPVPEGIENIELWVGSAVTAVAAFFVLYLGRKLAIRKLEKTAPHSKMKFDDLLLELLRDTKTSFFVMVAGYCAAKFLPISENAHLYLHYAFLFLLFLQVGAWFSGAITFFVEDSIQQSDPGKSTTLHALGYMAKLVIWTTIGLLVLKNFGVDVTALIAGLGIGGVAIALAVQNILGDLLASLSIVLDKPFVVGDAIDAGSDAGTVEYIGLKTTRLKSTTGEQLIFSNSDLLRSRIRNFKRMRERRAVFHFNLSFDTSSDRLQKVQNLVEQEFTKHKNIRFDRCHLSRFSQAAFEFEVVYWVLSPEYQDYARAQHGLSLGLIEALRGEEMAFADSSSRILMQENHARK